MWSDQSLKNLLGFERDSNTMLVGPTSSGKTTLLKRILQEGTFVGGTPKKYIVVSPRETVDDWKGSDIDKPIQYMEGLAGAHSLFEHSDKVPENSVVIFDDFMTMLDQVEMRRMVEKWFSVTSHHRHLWTFFVTHDMFHKALTTIRRNTQNFILFNVLQSDYRSASDFTTRLLGAASGSAFLALWQEVLADAEKGWIRLDQKIHRGAPLKTVVSMGGVTLDSAWIAARSGSLTDPLFIDVMTNPSVPDNPKFQIPDNMVNRQVDNGESPVARKGEERDSGDAPGDWSSNM